MSLKNAKINDGRPIPWSDRFCCMLSVLIGCPLNVWLERSSVEILLMQWIMFVALS